MAIEDKIYINYPKLVDDAMRDIAKKLLISLSKEGLKGEHYFLITFMTSHPMVNLSNRLKAKYPNEMTIILQHQFENLLIKEDHFSVRLSFDGIKENVLIPFDAMLAFVDPSTKFALQFTYQEKTNKKIPKAKKAPSSENENVGSEEKVILLDNFRKKT